MNIGIFGLWGMNIPGVAHGGFESIFSEVGARLVERGHEVTIYCRGKRYPEHLRLDRHRGVRLIYADSIETKSLSALSATLIALVHGLRHNEYDIFMFVNVGMGFHCALARMAGKNVVLNVDGLDWQRSKWNWLGKSFFRLAATAAMLSCNRLVTDSIAMQDIYREKFGKELAYIPYGADLRVSHNAASLESFGVEPRGYYFLASRFVPENNVDLLINAFVRTKVRRKLLVAGSANYESEFHQRLRSNTDPRVQFLGHIHDQEVFDELMCNCYAYLHGHSVGGTNPVLLRAMGSGACILALNTRFNAEVLRNHGILFENNIAELAMKIQSIDDNSDLALRYRKLSPQRIKNHYTWNICTDGYEKIFYSLLTNVEIG
jgi:glycosyltransferase involved in cell wall biosynthesis